MQNQTVFGVYIDDDNSNCSSNPKDILKSEKTFYEKLTLKRKSLKLLLLNFLTKFLTIRKSNEQFNLCEAEIFFNEIIESINSQKKI